MASLWGGALFTVLPEPGAARPTVMDPWLQVLLFSPSGHNGASFCWGAGSASVSVSAASSYTAALFSTLSLEVSDKLCIHCYKL